MCDDQDDGKDGNSLSPEEEREMKRMNKSCSEHQSEEPLVICFISNDVYTSPGRNVSIG